MQQRSLGVLQLRLCLLAISASSALLGVLAADLTKEPFTIRISCGSFNDVRTAPTNALWYRDFGYTGGRGLDNQGLRGVIPSDISKLQHLQSINLSGNSIKGNIPFSLGTISGLQVLDMSYNELNGSIPESLGQLTSLQILNLNGNDLSGRVPASLGGRPLHRARFNFTDNSGLCGIPGLRECGPHLSVASKIGMSFGVLVAFLFLVVFAACWWKRRQNILRARKLAAAREAPYAKSRTQFTRDVQMAKHHHPHESSRSGNNGSSPHLLS